MFFWWSASLLGFRNFVKIFRMGVSEVVNQVTNYGHCDVIFLKKTHIYRIFT